MGFEFKLPEIGEGVTEGEVVKWLVNEGEEVGEDQPLVEVMTDKATVEIASPKAGRIEKIMAESGDVIPVGNVLVVINENGSAGQVIQLDSKSAQEKPEEEKKKAQEKEDKPQKETSTDETSSPSQMGARVLASPATRKLAREKGIDLDNIQGSGPNGRITREDVLNGSKKSSSGASQPTHEKREEERIPVRGIRKKIAAHMVHSKHTAPHFTLVEEVDMTEVVRLREKAKPEAEKKGIKLTFLPFIIQAVCHTLKSYPMLNASLDDDAQEIIVKPYFNIGLAAATENGLIVPVIKNADQKNIWQLAEEVLDLANKARKGQLSLDELQGGTFTITSTGNSGGILSTPIINHPEVAILALNRIKDTPLVIDGEVAIRKVGYLSLSLDHRVIDGAVAAEYLQYLKTILETPGLMLL